MTPTNYSNRGAPLKDGKAETTEFTPEENNASIDLNRFIVNLIRKSTMGTASVLKSALS